MNWYCHHQYTDQPTSALYLIEAPDPIVSLAEMKQHLRVDDTDNDSIIQALTAAATIHLDGRDGFLGRALGEQTWELRLSWFPGCGYIQIPLPPLIEIVSVKYLDTSDVEQTVSASDYTVVGETNRGRVFLKQGKYWPVISSEQEPVRIKFRAGYIDSSVSPPVAAIPQPIIAAIKLITSNLYENRESIVIGQSISETMTITALLQPYRVFS